MLIVSGVIEVQPDKRDEAIALAREMMAETASEQGCLQYRFYADIENENRFRVFEEWSGDDALQAHFETPHMARFNARIADILAAPPRITRYQVSDHGFI